MEGSASEGGSTQGSVVLVLMVKPRRPILAVEDTTPGWEDLVPDTEDVADGD